MSTSMPKRSVTPLEPPLAIIYPIDGRRLSGSHRLPAGKSVTAFYLSSLAICPRSLEARNLMISLHSKCLQT